MEENKNIQESTQSVEHAPKEFKYIIARKLGMTQVYTPDGELKGVSVLEAGPCTVVYTRTKEKDGYNAVCLGFGEKTKNINKPIEGIFKKYNVKPVEHLKEFRLENVSSIKSGQIVSLVDRFKEGEWVDVSGITIGKGFAGAMKRHNFRGQPASHGASDRERAPGSLASRRALGRVMPGQRMAGRLGGERVTVQKIKIVKILPEKNIIMVNGSVPGKEGSIVYIKSTVKKINEHKHSIQKAQSSKAGKEKAGAKKK